MSPWVAPAAFAVLAGYAAWSDARVRRIPNWLCLLTAATGLVVVADQSDLADTVDNIAHALIALVIGGFGFYKRIWGGGDAKFYAASAVWLDLDQFFTLLSLIAAAGGVLVLAMFALRSNKSLKRERFSVPYGIAIGVGALLSLLWSMAPYRGAIA
jgi:prepilin peptidase CpaA